MDRRLFLQNSLILSAVGLTLNLLPENCFGFEDLPANSPLLNGVIPQGANPAISMLSKFTHHHFLYIPQEILNNPPAAGFTTATSMVVPSLGVSQTLIRQSRHFHYHEFTIRPEQIASIRDGRLTTIEILLEGQLNHRFVFNQPKSFEEQRREIESRSIAQGLPRVLRGPVVPRRVLSVNKP